MAVTDLIPRIRSAGRPAITRTTRTTRTNPLVAFHEEVNRLFDDLWNHFDEGGSFPSVTGSWPRIEVMETDEAVEIHAELPGLGENDVEVLLHDDHLTLRGEKRGAGEDRERRVSERFYGRFERHIALPAEVEPEKANASFTRGVLTVTLPKSQGASPRVRRIPIAAR